MAGAAAIQVLGKTELSHALDAWDGEARAPRAMWNGFYRDVVAPAVDKRFQSQGPGWAPLSPRYAAWKARKHPGQGIEVLSGAMRAALTGYGAPPYVVNPTGIDITGKGIPYWPFQQQGTNRMPARPTIVVSDFSEAAGAYIEAYLAKQARTLGLKAVA